jgi:hypothetical protein
MQIEKYSSISEFNDGLNPWRAIGTKRRSVAHQASISTRCFAKFTLRIIFTHYDLIEVVFPLRASGRAPANISKVS